MEKHEPLQAVKIKPSAKWYILSALMVFVIPGLALLLHLGLIFNVIVGDIVDLPTFKPKENMRLIVPGSKTFNLKEAGKYNIFFEYKSDFEGNSFDYPQDKDIGIICRVIEADTQTDIPLQKGIGTYTYSVDLPGNEVSGIKLWHFEIDKPGQYIISAQAKDPNQNERFVLKVDAPVFESFVEVISFIFAMCLTTFLACVSPIGGIVIFIITLIKRINYKKQLQPSPDNLY